jgi:ABC-2 type transport system permease protein
VTWTTIARKDVSDAARSRAVWLLAALLALVFVGYAIAHGFLAEATFPAFLERTAGITAAVVPILALVLGYKSVAADRDDGSLLLTLSLPHSRRDVMVGAFIGRTVVLLVPTLAVLAVAGGVGALRYGTAGATLYPWFLLVTGLYGTAFVGVAVALSAADFSDRRLAVAALGAYLLLVQFYQALFGFVLFVLHRGDTAVFQSPPDWTLLARLAQPSEAYYRLLRVGLDIEQAGRYLGADAPVYVGWWVALVLLAGWALAPLVLGYRRFRVDDL